MPWDSPKQGTKPWWQSKRKERLEWPDRADRPGDVILRVHLNSIPPYVPRLAKL